ncbi:hypothetical protein V7121_03820 [Neobacillus drentensis]
MIGGCQVPQEDTLTILSIPGGQYHQPLDGVRYKFCEGDFGVRYPDFHEF